MKSEDCATFRVGDFITSCRVDSLLHVSSNAVAVFFFSNYEKSVSSVTVHGIYILPPREMIADLIFIRIHLTSSIWVDLDLQYRCILILNDLAAFSEANPYSNHKMP